MPFFIEIILMKWLGRGARASNIKGFDNEVESIRVRIGTHGRAFL